MISSKKITGKTHCGRFVLNTIRFLISVSHENLLTQIYKCGVNKYSKVTEFDLKTQIEPLSILLQKFTISNVKLYYYILKV